MSIWFCGMILFPFSGWSNLAFQSGKSTQKRQKQYFEQRKWRRQQEVASVGNDKFDGSNNMKQHQRNNQSLDVLSLLNVPKSIYSTGDHASSTDYHVWKSTTPVYVDGIASMNPVTTPGKRGPDVESGTPSGHNQANALSKRFLHSSSNSSNHPYEARIDGKDCNIAPSGWVSVFDLISDDVAPEVSKRYPAHEAHAGFSIEGLGRVGADTPVHSPQQLCWDSPAGRSSSTEAARQKSSKKFDHASDDIEIEMEPFSRGDCLPFSCNFMDSGRKTGCLLNKSGGRKREMSGVMDQMGCRSYKKSAYGGTDAFNDVQGKYSDFWDGSSSLLHDRFLDEDDTAWKHAGLNDGTRMKIKNLPELMLEASHLPKRYPRKATVTFDSLDPSAQYEKHESRQDFGFGTLDDSSVYPWSCLMAKNERDSLNSFRGESCSSNADKVEGFTNRTSTRGLFSSEILMMNPRFIANYDHRTKDKTWPEEKCESSGEFPIISSPSSSQQGYNRPASKTKLEYEDCWLPEDGFPAVSINLRFRHVNSFHQSSVYDHAFLPSDAWEEDSIDGIIPDLLLDSNNLSLDFSKHDTSTGWSPSADPGLSACSLQTFNSCASSNTGTGKDTPALHQDFEISIVSTDLSSTVGSHGPVDLPTTEFSGDANVSSNGQNKLESQPSKPIKCAGSCSLVSEQVTLKNSRHGSDGNDKVAIPCIVARSSEDEIGSKCQSGCQYWHRHKAKDADISWSGAEGSGRVCEVLETVEPPCELMMLESRVLQLLCVHKGKKLARMQIFLKVIFFPFKCSVTELDGILRSLVLCFCSEGMRGKGLQLAWEQMLRRHKNLTSAQSPTLLPLSVELLDYTDKC
ncbi:hypothetical protein AKJ16_DCAP10052 [Drosera capensis]